MSEIKNNELQNNVFTVKIRYEHFLKQNILGVRQIVLDWLFAVSQHYAR
jgi:nicotinamide mononucleotide (NMN) deamidase PncC